jgi:hypothetical protein
MAVNLCRVLENRLYNNPIDLYQHIVDQIEDNHLAISIEPEGWDLEYIGFYQFLDFIRRYLHPGLQVTIETCNIGQKHPPYVTLVQKVPGFLGLAMNWWKPEYLRPKQIEKTFGLFVCRPDISRLHFLSHLYSMYGDKSILTANCRHADIRRMLHHKEAMTIESSPALYDLLKILPISGPNSEHFNSPGKFDAINIPLYHRFFCEIVCETNFTQGFFPTEKIWRPMLYKTPFIVVGAPGFVENLKALGFRTFDAYWDETYDTISLGADDTFQWSWLRQKHNNINSIISMLASKNNSELQEMYDSMQDILDHNYNLLSENFGDRVRGRLHNLGMSAKL